MGTFGLSDWAKLGFISCKRLGGGGFEHIAWQHFEWGKANNWPLYNVQLHQL